jgi:N-methylhydantoinase A
MKTDVTHQPRYRIGIDVGGTFTDFILADMREGGLQLHKEPSVPADPSLAVERGAKALLESRAIPADAVELVVHGTTIGLNAIIQRRGARLALVVSRGNRDVLEIARIRLPSSYDVTAPREAPLIRRDLVFEVSARMRSDGSIVAPVDEAEVARIADALRAKNVNAVAVMLLNSYRDPQLEIAVADLLRRALPDVLVTESGVVWPEVREYERCLVAGLNAYIHPLMRDYFDRLETRVGANRIAAPIYITANNGGTLSLDTARARPIDTVLSGPASGVVASVRVGEVAGRRRLVTFDMGGTSADISIVRDGAPEFTTTTFVGDFPLIMPVVNVGAIGAGGGSILWVDDQGFLKVGPLSAGADPGPVSYGRGGTAPTITDCYLATGIIDPERFLGGRMRLDRDAALGALGSVAAGLGLDGPIAAAEAALRVASAKMASEITKLLATAGADPRDFALVAYGGAGPTHAILLAEEARLDAVLVPTTPGAFCALGAVLADVRRDYAQTARHLIAPPGVLGEEQDGWPATAAAVARLRAQALAWIADEGDIVGAHRLAVSADMRYPGQAFELDIPATADPPDAAGWCAAFHAEHQRLYGFSDPASPVQITTVRLGVVGKVPPVSFPRAGDARPQVKGTRIVWREGRPHKAAVYDRSEFGRGAVVYGPAIVEQADTTTLILDGWRCEADAVGTLHLNREAPR